MSYIDFHFLFVRSLQVPRIITERHLYCVSYILKSKKKVNTMAKCCCNSRTGFALKSIQLNSLYGSEQLLYPFLKKGAFTFFSRRASIDLRRRPPFLGVNERRRYLYMQVETVVQNKEILLLFFGNRKLSTRRELAVFTDGPMPK